MHRKHIRATVGTSDVDISTGVFIADRFLYYNGLTIITVNAVRGPATSTDNAVARFDGTDGHLLQNSTVTIDDAGNVTGVTTINGFAPSNIRYTGAFNPVAREVAVFADGSGPPYSVTYSNGPRIQTDGSMTNVTTINTRDPLRWVDGSTPAASTDNAIALWDGVGGRLIKDSVVTVSTGGDITTPGNIDPTTVAGIPKGVLVKSSSSTPHTDNAVVRWDTGSGHPIQDSTVIIDDSGNITGVTSINGIAPSTWVVGPASSTDDRMAYFSGTTGKLLAQTNYTRQGVVTTSIGDGLVASRIPIYTGVQGSSGTLIQDSGVIFSDLVFRSGSYTIGNLPKFANSGSSTFIIQDAGIPSANVVEGSGSGTSGAAVAFTSVSATNYRIANAGYSAGDVVRTSSLSTDNAVVRWDANTGRIVQNSVVIIDDSGNVTGLGTLNTRTIARWVDGPASGGSTDNTLAVWDGTSGRLLKDGAANAIAVDPGTGLITTPVGVLVHSNSGPVNTDNAVVRWDGTGQHTQNSAVIIDDSGNITGAGTLNTRTIANWVESSALFPTNGRILVVAADNTRQIQPSGVLVTDFVTASANFGTDNRVLRSDGTTKAAQASVVTLDDTGNYTGVGTINSLAVGHIADRVIGGTTPVSYVFTAVGSTTDYNIYFYLPYSVGGTANLVVTLTASSGFNQGHVMCGAQGGIISSNGGSVSLLTTGSTAIPSLGVITVVSSLTGFSPGATLTVQLSGTSHNGGTGQILAFAT